ncbi:MAG: hypothetical protein ACD_75C02615G0010, partial [uncultured bacterium]
PAAEAQPSPRKSEDAGSVAGVPEAEEPLRILIGQLTRGEVAAEEQLGEVEKMLAGTGFAGNLQQIASFIDDIEYESAAEMAQNLLILLRQQHGG